MNNAFLVRFSCSIWTARRMDKDATRKAKADAGAGDKASVKLYKTVIAAEELEAINTLANTARGEHRRRTIPWNYEGVGAITAEGYAPYKAAMAVLEKEFYAAVAKFYTVYDVERDKARDYLGNLFNPADYPTSADLRNKFSFAVSVEPIADPEAFRPVGLPADVVQEIKADIVNNNRDALEDANMTAWQRVIERVEMLKVRLSEFNKGDVTKFYDSWLNNVAEIINLIPSINIANDADLSRIAQKLTALTAYTNEELKQHEHLRAEVIKQASAILAGIDAAYKRAA